MNKKKIRIARLSVFSNSFLIALKVIAGVLTGSVSIISEAIHSGMDLIAAIIAYFSIRASGKPPDREHPYGHGKYENVSGVIEAILIFIAAAWIIFEALKKLRGEIEISSLGIGSLVMFISAAVNALVSSKLYKVAKETDSIALEADALHLKTDIYTSLGVGTGLLLIHFTNWHFFDPIIAIIVAIMILRESYSLLAKAYSPLLDSSLNPEEIDRIESILTSMEVHYHGLKSRKSGNRRFLEFHIELPSDEKLKDVHIICDTIERELKKQLKNLEVQIHAEPLGEGNDTGGWGDEVREL